MTFSKLTAATAAFSLVLLAGSAAAQDVGATVTGNDGNAIGTVLSNDGTTIVVDTGTHQVPLGPDAFAVSDTGPTLNTTKGELDTAYGALAAEQAAALQAALVAGAAVVTADAQPFATINTVNANDILLDRAGSTMILGKEMFALNADGGVMLLANLADIEAAIAAQAS